VSAWTREQERWELAEQLQAVGVAAAPVEHLRDTYERDPQLQHHYQHVRQPSAPDVDIPIDAEAIRFVGHEHILERAPMLGEHNEPVLCDVAGLSPEEFAQLVVDGVIV
jgi:crotonobetainyl-CoA:carnitine CoA-transferase CaiB-like acyl-CoA transferase